MTRRSPLALVQALLGVALVQALLAMALAGPASAHVGSPDTWFEGNAGPYPVRVVVRAPGVVPGLAEIDVRVLGGHATKVTAQPFAWDAGEKGAPPPDVAHAVPGDPQLWSVNLWFMVATSYGVHVTVRGAEGTGTVIVPVQAVATGRLPLEGPLSLTLIALGLFLFVGLITVVGAATREASLPPGSEPQAADRMRARIGIAVAGAILIAALTGGRSWWDSADRAYARERYRPFHIQTVVSDRGDARMLSLAIDDDRWQGRGWTPLVPDHGKLMHLFLVRDSRLDVIAHLHPVLRDSSHFETALPPLPPGTYRVYADIVHESGFAQTLVDSVRIPSPAAMPWSATDTDDSWFDGGSSPDAANNVRFALADGSTLVWERGTRPLVERTEAPLQFRVLAPDGSAARLEPFLGMAGHAVLVRDDGTVFAHLHPIGTVAMAAQMVFEMRTPADSVAGSLGRRMSEGGGAMPGMEHSMGHDMSAMGEPAGLPGMFSIPYGFPAPGHYRLWVQVKRGGRILTAAFDLIVRAAKKA